LRSGNIRVVTKETGKLCRLFFLFGFEKTHVGFSVNSIANNLVVIEKTVNMRCILPKIIFPESNYVPTDCTVYDSTVQLLYIIDHTKKCNYHETLGRRQCMKKFGYYSYKNYEYREH
jgi:hypothetical protein